MKISYSDNINCNKALEVRYNIINIDYVLLGIYCKEDNSRRHGCRIN